MREKLSKRAQKFYRTNPEAYLELKEIEQRGTRICPGCEKEVELSLLECPECGHILRTSRWKDAWKWILGGNPSVDARVRGIHDTLFREYPCL